MSTDRSEEVVRGLFSALNESDFSRVAGLIEETCLWESIGYQTRHRGWQRVVDGLKSARKSFPDWHVDVRNLVVAGPFVAIEWEASGTHTGACDGHEATGRVFRRRGCSVAEIADGKITRYRDYFDRLTLDEQLGLTNEH